MCISIYIYIIFYYTCIKYYYTSYLFVARILLPEPVEVALLNGYLACLDMNKWNYIWIG